MVGAASTNSGVATGVIVGSTQVMVSSTGSAITAAGVSASSGFAVPTGVPVIGASLLGLLGFVMAL